MKTYPLLNNDGQMYASEVDNLTLGRRGAVRVVKTIPGVEVIRLPKRVLSWFREEEFLEFMVGGIRFGMMEPYGDNSRYWVGRSPSGGWCEQLEIVHSVFQSHGK